MRHRTTPVLRVSTLYQDFDPLPYLHDIPQEHRWRLLVARQKVESLGRLGIDTLSNEP